MSSVNGGTLRRNAVLFVAVSMLLGTLTGCWLADIPAAEPPMAATISPTATSANTTLTESPTLSTPAPTLTPESTRPASQPDPTARPTTTGAIYGDEGGVFWADLNTGDMAPLIAGAAGASWALQGQELAMVHGRFVERVDLDSGQSALFEVPTEGLMDAQVFWEADGHRLLYVGWVEPDPASDEPELRLVFCELSSEGAGTPVAYAGMPAMLLGYDAAGERLLLWAPAEAETLQLLGVDLSTGEAQQLATLEGLGELALGPHGALAWLATAETGYQLLAVQGDGAPTAHALPEGAYASNLVWSQDGKALAFFLHQGALYDPEATNLGLYTIDLASGEIKGPLGEAAPYARIAAWTPDGQGLILHQRDAETERYDLVTLDGAHSPVSIKGSATLMGWASRPELPNDAPTLDPWQRRFISAAGDADATAAAAASFVAAHLDMPLAERALRLEAYYAAAAWPQDERELRQVDTEVFVLQTPPNSIVVTSLAGSQVVGQGSTLGEVRVDGDRLAVVYGGIFGEQQQWTVALLRQNEGGWETRWQPLGRSDWITTGGAVTFEGKGIDTLQVTGTSLGQPSDAFFECAACPLREFSATWQLQGDAYERVPALPADAPLANVHWEMTVHSPYALVYEAVRRVRAGEATDDVATLLASEQLAAMELQGESIRLVVSSVSPEMVIFGPADAPTLWQATIAAGRVAQVTAR